MHGMGNESVEWKTAGRRDGRKEETHDDKDREDEETEGNAVLSEGGGGSRTDEDDVTSPIQASAPIRITSNRTSRYSQANQREDHDGLVSTPQGISEDTTENGGDVNEEGVELGKGKRSTIRLDGYQSSEVDGETHRPESKARRLALTQSTRNTKLPVRPQHRTRRRSTGERGTDIVVIDVRSTVVTPSFRELDEDDEEGGEGEGVADVAEGRELAVGDALGARDDSVGVGGGRGFGVGVLLVEGGRTGNVVLLVDLLVELFSHGGRRLRPGCGVEREREQGVAEEEALGARRGRG